MRGGSGSVWGTMIGVLILGVIGNMLSFLDVSPYLQGSGQGRHHRGGACWSQRAGAAGSGTTCSREARLASGARECRAGTESERRRSLGALAFLAPCAKRRTPNETDPIAILVIAITLLGFGQMTLAQAKKLKIGVSIPAADHGWTAGVGWWAKTRDGAASRDRLGVRHRAEPREADRRHRRHDGARASMGLVILATESAPLTPIAKRPTSAASTSSTSIAASSSPSPMSSSKATTRRSAARAAEFIVDKINGTGRQSRHPRKAFPCTVNTDRVTRRDGGLQVAIHDIKILGAAAGDVEPAEGAGGHAELPHAVPADRRRVGVRMMTWRSARCRRSKEAGREKRDVDLPRGGHEGCREDGHGSATR